MESPPVYFYLPLGLWHAIQAHLSAQVPEEACGLLAGRQSAGAYHALQAIPVTNILHSPTRFRMAPAEQLEAFNHIEAQGLELVGIFHSHPHGPDDPSLTDIDEAYYPDAVNLICSGQDGGWCCRAYLIREGLVQEVAVEFSALDHA